MSKRTVRAEPVEACSRSLRDAKSAMAASVFVRLCPSTGSGRTGFSQRHARIRTGFETCLQTYPENITLNRTRCAAFTLLEVMVVLAVIAIITAVALPVIARSSPERKVTQQAERIKQVIDLMCENAEIDGRELGFAVSKNSYQVLIPPSANIEPSAAGDSVEPWQAFKGREVFAKFSLGDGMQLALSLGNNAEIIELGDELPAMPQLPCLAAGELPEFRLTVSIGIAPDKISRTIVAQPPSVEKLANWAAMIEANSQ